MEFVFGGGGGGSGGAPGPPGAAAAAVAQGGLGHDNGPILYTEPNRTSAIDDIRSVVLYIFIVAIFLSFFLILPGIRTEKFPTFLCITTSLVVTSIILIALFGTSWHVANSEISAAYKAFSRDRIQGDLSVNIGLQSVNITLRAHKYYILHATDGPIIMDNSAARRAGPAISIMSMFVASAPANAPETSLAEEVASVDELEPDDEPFSASSAARWTRSAAPPAAQQDPKQRNKTARRPRARGQEAPHEGAAGASETQEAPKFTIKRVNVDINYNERFYWIEPNQMRQEFHGALERGLPYPILTVVEYLSQDEAGFSWSRQYRAAGYYASMVLWLSVCTCVLMFCLHCAAPKYGIYAMQVLGGLLLLTNLTYSTLVPRGEHKLVIPFEGRSLEFRFGWQFWLVLAGGCLSFGVGTCIVLYDKLYPNHIFTTVLDVDFDSQRRYYRTRRALAGQTPRRAITDGSKIHFQPQQAALPPPFFKDSLSSKGSSLSSSAGSSASLSSNAPSPVSVGARPKPLRERHSRLANANTEEEEDDDDDDSHVPNEESPNQSDCEPAHDESPPSLRRTAPAASSRRFASTDAQSNPSRSSGRLADRLVLDASLSQYDPLVHQQKQQQASERPPGGSSSSVVVGFPAASGGPGADEQRYRPASVQKRRNQQPKNLRSVEPGAAAEAREGAGGTTTATNRRAAASLRL